MAIVAMCAVCVQVEARRCRRAHVCDWDGRMPRNMVSGVRGVWETGLYVGTVEQADYEGQAAKPTAALSPHTQ